jgi:hypothetical protein
MTAAGAFAARQDRADHAATGYAGKQIAQEADEPLRETYAVRRRRPSHPAGERIGGTIRQKSRDGIV